MQRPLSGWPAPPPAGVPRWGRGWGRRAAAACAVLSCPGRAGGQVWPNRVAVQCAGFPGDGLSVVARCSGYCLTRGCLTAGCARSQPRGLFFPRSGSRRPFLPPSCSGAQSRERARRGGAGRSRLARGRRRRELWGQSPPSRPGLAREPAGSTGAQTPCHNPADLTLAGSRRRP